jgi:hypothetical protein
MSVERVLQGCYTVLQGLSVTARTLRAKKRAERTETSEQERAEAREKERAEVRKHERAERANRFKSPLLCRTFSTNLYVRRVLQGCYKGLTDVIWVFEGCHKDVTRASQGYYKGVTRVLQGC